MIDTLVTAPPFAERPLWGPSEEWGRSFAKEILDWNLRKIALFEYNGGFQQRERLYDAVSDLLETELHDRLTLYFPLMTLPQIRGAERSAKRFIDAYTKAWYRVLNDTDMRADFVDGDVPDAELEDSTPEMICQAAFLAPHLQRLGYIDIASLPQDPIVQKTLNYAVDPNFDHTDFQRPTVMTAKRQAWLAERDNFGTSKWPGGPNQSSELSFNLVNVDDKIAYVRSKLIRRYNDDIIHPCFIVFGSQLKGYGRPDGDIDIAVFLKPDAGDRELINSWFKDTLGFVPLQYQLSENGRIVMPEHLEANLGMPYDVHVLMNGAWYGDEEAICNLRNQIIKPFCQEQNVGLRRFYHRMMERDLLQYRLLHRGYAQYNDVREKWTFFDEGYRWTALRLYINYVHVPYFGTP